MTAKLTTLVLALCSFLLVNCSTQQPKEEDKPLFISDVYEGEPEATREVAQEGAEVSAEEDEYKDDDYGSAAPKPDAAAPYSDLAGKPDLEETKAFRTGMYIFLEDCPMKAQPDVSAEDEGTVSATKQLWVVAHNQDWHIVHKKKGDVYIASSCRKTRKIMKK